MKVILSRKGFDSRYGKGASPIMPNGDLISLPIPAEEERGINYADISYLDQSYKGLMQELNVAPPKNSVCHLDPDLIRHARPRNGEWHGAFGQQGGDQTHLANHGVGVGDLFLFFGSFKRTRQGSSLCFERDHVRHIIFGYLKVGKVLYPDQEVENGSYAEHPHFQNKARYNKLNALYAATAPEDYGTFKYRDELVLTKNGYPKSFWELPSFFLPKGVKTFSRHSEKDFHLSADQVLLTSRGIGQDFVISNNPEVEAWALDLIAGSKLI